jgi:uncharacterized protein (DUF58 family)
VTAQGSLWKLAPFAGALLFAVSLPVRSPWLAVLAAGVIVLPFIQPLRTSFRFRRGIPGRVRVGSSVTARYAVTNSGRMATPPAVVTDAIAGCEPISIALPPLRPGETAEIEMPVLAVSRAWPDAPSPITVTQRGWFVGSSGPLAHALPGGPIVRPRLLPWPGALPLLSVDTVGLGQVRAAEGTDVHSVRAWQPGDPPRAVHWRSTARVGSPMVLERAEEFTREVILVVADGGAGPEWEDGVSRAAWLHLAAVRGGHPFALYGGHGAPPVAEGVEAAQDWFAALGAVGPVDLRPLAEHVRNARATGAIAVLTANPSLTAALRRLSPRVRIVEACR